METIDIKNKKWSDDEFYKVRKEILATWETGKEVDPRRGHRLPQIPARTQNLLQQAQQSKKRGRYPGTAKSWCWSD